jgi:hypothetical protein
VSKLVSLLLYHVALTAFQSSTTCSVNSMRSLRRLSVQRNGLRNTRTTKASQTRMRKAGWMHRYSVLCGGFVYGNCMSNSKQASLTTIRHDRWSEKSFESLRYQSLPRRVVKKTEISDRWISTYVWFWQNYRHQVSKHLEISPQCKRDPFIKQESMTDWAGPRWSMFKPEGSCWKLNAVCAVQ